MVWIDLLAHPDLTDQLKKTKEEEEKKEKTEGAVPKRQDID